MRRRSRPSGDAQETEHAAPDFHRHQQIGNCGAITRPGGTDAVVAVEMVNSGSCGSTRV